MEINKKKKIKLHGFDFQHFETLADKAARDRYIETFPRVSSRSQQRALVNDLENYIVYLNKSFLIVQQVPLCIFPQMRTIAKISTR